MSCQPCVAGLHELCLSTAPVDGWFFECCCYSDTVTTEPQSLGDMLVEKMGTPTRSGDTLKDVLSTGRHRAALLKPITEGMLCEWAGLKSAGGGVEPITGCVNNQLFKSRGRYAVHHGPDKNALNNDSTNLHAICPTCHNRWHTLNDKYYGDGTAESRPDAGQTWVPNVEWKIHDSVTMATKVELLENEMNWKLNRTQREDVKNGN